MINFIVVAFVCFVTLVTGQQYQEEGAPGTEQQQRPPSANRLPVHCEPGQYGTSQCQPRNVIVEPDRNDTVSAIERWKQSRTMKMNYSDCGSSFQVTGVYVHPCYDDLFCPMYKGGNMTVNVTFVAGRNVENPQAAILGKIGGAPWTKPVPPDGGIPFLRESTACTFPGMSCPLVEGKEYTIQMWDFMETYWPSFTIHMRFRLREPGDRHRPWLVCVMFTGAIMDWPHQYRPKIYPPSDWP